MCISQYISRKVWGGEGGGGGHACESVIHQKCENTFTEPLRDKEEKIEESQKEN